MLLCWVLTTTHGTRVLYHIHIPYIVRMYTVPHMRLSLDKTTYGTLDAVRVPASTKFVGSYVGPSEEVNARVTAANKAFYKMKTIMRQERPS